MKKILLLVLTGMLISCSALRRSSPSLDEDELVITRKFIGVYMDYRHTGPESFAGPNIIWIKTSMDSIYGKISAYGKKCDFSPGDRLYLRRVYYAPGGVFGYWEYHIENDSSLYYKLSEFQHDSEVPIETWF